MTHEEFTTAINLIAKGIDSRITGVKIHWLKRKIPATAAIIHYSSGLDRMVDLYPIESYDRMILAIIGKVIDIRKENYVSKN